MGVQGLRVASRTSTFRARQGNSDLTAIARALSVSHVLEGSVRTAGGRLRVTAQLTDVATGFQLWSERFDRDAVDVFAVQDEIAAGVVQAVKARLAPGTAAPVPARSQVRNLEAYRQYLQGRHLRYSKNDHAAALRCFEAALALDPSHAPSMVGLAEVKVLVAIYGLAPTRESHAAANAAIERAAQIQGETSEGLFVLGLIAVCERDWSGAERTLGRALEADPDNVRALCWTAILLSTQGRLDKARVHLARAQAIDPLAPYPYAMSGWSLLTARKTREAMPLIDQALAFDPDNSLALWTFAMALVAEGRAAEAITWAERATTPSHRAGVINGVRGWVLASAGKIEEARAVLESLRSRPALSPTLVSEGWILAALGDRDAAFAVFDRAADERQALVAFVGLPPFDTVRDDPRFGALLAKLGLQRNADKMSPPSPSSGEARADEGFWVAVLPFKSSGVADLTALADGLSEEIVTGFSRFSCLRVISRGATSRLASGATDVRALAKEIGARFVLEGSLRQAGSRLRAAVQLTDAATGAHLWAETYDRPFGAGDAFALQDDLVPRIVSTCADHFGVLARAISEAVRGKPLADLTPYEALMRGFGYHFRLSPAEHAEARDALERAVERAPQNADCWAMLSWVYAHEYAHGFNPRPGSLDRALDAARRAADLTPSNALAQQTLAVVLFFRKEKAACLSAAERALTLNPLDGSNEAMFLITFSGEWERGCALIRRAMDRNPHHPRWYGMVLGLNEYRAGNYRGAVEEAVKANAPEIFWTNFLLAAAHAQLGETEAAGKALSDLLVQKNDFAVSGEEHLRKWFEPQFVADLMAGLRKAGLGAPAASGPARAEEGFWVAVLPFKYGGGNPDLTALAEGLSEEIVTGLSRFSYLRVLARSSTSRLGSGAVDVQRLGQEIGARYVMEGSLRQAGARVRAAVQLTDAATGAHLWAETYERPFGADEVFALQDDLVARIVSTVADQHGVLPHSMSALIRNKSNEQLTPLEAVLRVFSFHERMSPEEHRNVRTLLERVVREHPDEGDCWAMLATLYTDEYMFGFEGEPDPLARAQRAARRAVEIAPTSWLASQALAQSLFFRRELQAFRPVAERTIALNPMDSAALAFISLVLALSGAWDRGLEVSDAARNLNPHFPGWYWLTPIFHAYHNRDYRAAIEAASRMNMPGYFWGPAAQAAAFGQLGEGEPARKAVTELLAIRPDFAATARDEFGKWFDREFLDHFIDGLVKAGLEVKVVPGPSPRQAASSPKANDPKVAIAVLPFSDMSPAKDQEYLCEGMAEEIMNALGGIKEIRVASRTSTFRAGRDSSDLPGIARALSVTHVLEGSVRTSGARLRVTAQLTDIATGYHLWSERFDREAADVFAVQDEISAGVVEAVRTRLSPGAFAIHARPPARNLEAYRSYLKGRHLRGKEDNIGAMAAYEEAIRLDPSHAPSWTGLAESTVLAAHFNIIPAREACAAARKAVAAAAELEGESANTRHVEAFIAYLERRWPEMETAWRRAIELQPTHVLALGSFGISLCARERFDEGLTLLARAREADPLASFPCTLTGFGLLERGRAEEGQRYLADALSFEKEDAAALYISAAALVVLGRPEEGIATLRHAVELTGRAAHFVGVLGWALATAGKTAEARLLLDELRARPKDAPALTAEAWLLGALGETDAAFEVMARAEDENQANLYYTGFPGFDALRADPRFSAFRERLGLSPNRTS